MAVFWYKDYKDMMNESSIGLTVGLYNDLQDFYEEPDVSGVEIDGEMVVQQSKLILSKARSTGLNKAQISQVVGESGISKPDQHLLSHLKSETDTLTCVTL